MAQAREGEFPVEGDRALADDGSVWTYEKVPDPIDGQDPFQWVQGEPWMSAEELEAAEEADQQATAHLSLDHRVYALAHANVRLVKREADLADTDPKEQFVLALATSAMRDSVIEVATGTRSNLEIGTLTRMRTFLGDPEVSTAQAELESLRRQVQDDVAPEAVVAKARGAVDALGSIAGKLPVDSDARKTINKILASTKPQPELTDKLFRQIALGTGDHELAKQALDASSAVVQAYG